MVSTAILTLQILSKHCVRSSDNQNAMPACDSGAHRQMSLASYRYTFRDKDLLPKEVKNSRDSVFEVVEYIFLPLQNVKVKNNVT